MIKIPQVVEKFTCVESNTVRYVTRTENYLPLPVPISEATNHEEHRSYAKRKAAAQEAKERLSVFQIGRAFHIGYNGNNNCNKQLDNASLYCTKV